MNSDACTRCVGVMLALVIGALSACRDSTPIGSVECIGEHIQCGFDDDQQNPPAPGLDTPHEPISSTGLSTLKPVWSGQPFENQPVPAPLLALTLIADADAQLWSISNQNGRVTLTKLDREGSALEEHTIEPPPSSRDPDGLHAMLTGVSPAGTNSNTTLNLQWTRSCNGRAGESPDCNFDEVLVFEALDREPRRVDLTGLGRQLTAVNVNASGMWSLVANNNDAYVDKRDLSAKLIWRQTGLLHLQAPYNSWQLSGALRSSDELDVLVGAHQADGSNLSGLDLWKLDASGSITTQQGIAWRGSYPEYAIDARGRDVIVGASLDGDLTLMRVLANGTSEGNQIVREEYLALRVDGFTLDSEGAAYVASAAGGRERKDWRELLCQLPDSGPARCFTLGEISASGPSGPLIDQVVVPEPGVAYVRSGSKLRRYELPAAPQ